MGIIKPIIIDKEFTMFRILYRYLALFFMVVLLMISCTTKSPYSPSATLDSTIAAKLSFSDAGITPAIFDSLMIIISGDDMEPVKKALMLDGVQAHEQIKVPAGVRLTATVSAYMDSTIVMQGQDTVSVKKGKTSELAIKMNFIVPTIILSQPNSTMSVGDSLTLYLAARNVTDLATIGAQVHFDPGKLQVLELGREDGFLTQNAGAVNQLVFSKNNTNGSLNIVLGIFPSVSAVSGSGNVGRIMFRAIDTGITDLSVQINNDPDSNYALFDKNAVLIYSMGIGGRITIQ